MLRLFVVALLLLAVAVPVMAQDTEPEPSDNPAFNTILLLAASVAGLVETLKPAINRARDRYAWTDDVHQLIVRLVAAVAAIALVFLTRTDADIFAAFDIAVSVPGWVAKLITALAVSGGSMFLWSAYAFLKPSPGASATVTTEGSGSATATVVSEDTPNLRG